MYINMILRAMLYYRIKKYYVVYKWLPFSFHGPQDSPIKIKSIS